MFISVPQSIHIDVSAKTITHTPPNVQKGQTLAFSLFVKQSIKEMT